MQRVLRRIGAGLPALLCFFSASSAFAEAEISAGDTAWMLSRGN